MSRDDPIPLDDIGRQSFEQSAREDDKVEEDEDDSVSSLASLLPDLEKDGHNKSQDESEASSAAALVGKIVPEGDDPSLTTLSLRVFILGIGLCSVGAAVSQLFYFKSNAPSFSSFFIVLISLPMGKLLAAYLPDKDLKVFRWRIPLNPGPFTIKEHLLISVIAGSGSTAAYAGDIIAVCDLFYHQDIGPIGGLLLLLTTQLIGFGIAGTCYNLLVRPTVMVWPAVLTQVALFTTLHGDANDSTKQRLRFFYIAFAACFIYQFLPAYWAPGLSSLAVLCWFSNDSWVLRALGSGYSGFGLGALSLDWAVIGSTSGLYTPFWASVNYFVGISVMMYVIAPWLYFGNVWDALKFPSPINSHLYDSNAQAFNVSAVIKPDFSLDEVAWEKAAPVMLTPFFATTYGVSFAILTSTIVTVLLWNRDTVFGALGSRKETDDPHVQLLERNYERVPTSWYLSVGFGTLLASIYLVVVYPLQLPVYALFLAIAVAAFFLVPCGTIMAITNTAIGLNVVTELIVGFMLPGRPIANITFKCFGVGFVCANSSSDKPTTVHGNASFVFLAYVHSLTLSGPTGRFKTGTLFVITMDIYKLTKADMKIPPKHLFLCQSIGTAVGSVVNFAFIKGVIEAKRGYLDGTMTDPTGQWTGRAPRIFYSASVVWGLIGPRRFFAGQYQVLYYGFIVGLILPLIPWYIYKKYPEFGKRYKLHKWSFPIMLHAAIGPPQRPTNIIAFGFLSAYLSQYYALRKHPKWFAKYNYVLSSALDAGTSVNALALYMLGLTTFGTHTWFNSATDTEHCLAGS